MAHAFRTPLQLVERAAKRPHARLRPQLTVPVIAARSTAIDRLSASKLLLLALCLSALVHVSGAVFILFSGGTKVAPNHAHEDTIEVAVVERIEAHKPVKIKQAKPTEIISIPKTSTAPPPPNEEAATETPPAEISGGISASSTSQSGSFSVAVGNTAYAEIPEVAKAPEEVKPYKAKEYAAFHLISAMPIYQRNISPADIRKLYPAEARQVGIELSVAVKLLVDDDGSVVEVKIAKDPGHGFAEATKKLALMMQFKPATINGRAVATEIPFTIEFRLE